MKPKTEFYKNFYDTSPIGFYTIDLETGEFLKTNSECLSMFGFESIEELNENYSFQDICCDEKYQKLLDSLETDTVTDFEIELNLPNKNGSSKWILLSARYCKNRDCIEGSMTDISDKKYVESELVLYKEKELKFLKDISEAIDQRIHDSFLSQQRKAQ